MRLGTLVVAVCALCITGSAQAIEQKAMRLTEELGTASMDECYLQYYYYIPCPDYSWFWGFYDWTYGDKVGKFFTIGDAPTAAFAVCDSTECLHITSIRVLDFAGYGQVYPGLYTVKFNIYCSDSSGCPVGNSLWESQPLETAPDWTTIEIQPPLAVGTCWTIPGPSMPRILVTATHIGTDCTYPQWGMDNISGSLAEGCQMHDVGCLPALYPRPWTSHYSTVHSGYYGVDFEHCPPTWFMDGGDTTQTGTTYGYLEFAWRLRVACLGNATEPTSWGQIKALYK